MKRYLFDSNALNLFVYRRFGVYEKAKELKRQGHIFGTAIPVVAEFLGGTMASETWKLNLPMVEQKLSFFRLWPFDLPAAREYARLFAVLKTSGVRMQSIDLMIAAIAMIIPNCVVISSDSDFQRVPGLTVENWVTN